MGDTRKLFMQALLEAQANRRGQEALQRLGDIFSEQSAPQPNVAPAPGPTSMPAPPMPRTGNLVSHPNVTRWSAQVADVARKYDIDPRVGVAMLAVESAGDPKAVSNQGAQGLMQFIPATWKRFGQGDPHNAQASLEAWGRYFRHLLDRYNGDYNRAIAAHHQGEANVDRGTIGPRGQAYVAKVNTLRRQVPMPEFVGLSFQGERYASVTAPETATDAAYGTLPSPSQHVSWEQFAPAHVVAGIRRKENTIRRAQAAAASLTGRYQEPARRFADANITRLQKEVDEAKAPYLKQAEKATLRPMEAAFKAEDERRMTDELVRRQEALTPGAVERKRPEEAATRPGELQKKEAEQRIKPLGDTEERSMNELLRLERAYVDIQDVLRRNRGNRTFLGGILDERGGKLALDQAIERFKAGKLRNLSEDEERLLSSLSILTSIEIHELAGSAQTAQELARLTGAFGQLPDVWTQTPAGFMKRLNAIGEDIADKLDTKAASLRVSPVGEKLARKQAQHLDWRERHQAELEAGQKHGAMSATIPPIAEVMAGSQVKSHHIAKFQELIENGQITEHGQLVGSVKKSGYSLKDPAIQWLFRVYGT